MEKYFNPEIETLSRAEIEALQLERLKKTVRHCMNNEFYRKKFAEAGITPDDIKTLADVRKLSRGGEEASAYGLQIYTKYLDRLNLFLLNRAKALWAAGQDKDSAYEVCSLLAQIDPDAACYAEAGKLMNEVKGQVRSDIDFEMREKYHDQIQLEKSRIEAAKAIGVAYGNHQKTTTTNLMWLR